MKVARCFFASASLLSALVFVTAAPATTSTVSSRLEQRVPMQTESVATPAASQVDQTDQAFTTYTAALSAAMVQSINEVPNVTWTAGMSEYFAEKSYEFFKRSCGVKLDAFRVGSAEVAAAPSDAQGRLPTYPVPHPVSSVPLPVEFDARTQWGAICPSLYDIRDQAGCGSCWAVAAAEAMTDRHCIASNGTKQPYLSAANILTCCGQEECGSCQGGYPINAWQFWVNTGVVTGGAFGSTGTCQPYPWAPCEHHTDGPLPQCVVQDATPVCSLTCSDGTNFHTDKSFGASAYKVPASETLIMQEIMQHGPVEAGFMVYEDFPHYKSGVYRHVQGNMVGGHAIKIVGWGVESQDKYWLVANSWNTNWGDAGYFKIARGENECMIEEMVFAGRTGI